MKKKALYQTYPDLLDHSTDPELIQLVQELDSICREPVAPASVNWSQLRVMNAQQGTREKGIILPFRGSIRLRNPFLRKAILIPAVLGLVLITTAFTFAFSSLLQELFQIEPSGSSLAFVAINQSATIAGHNVELDAGYADANQVILGYTISSTSENGRIQGDVELSMRDGTRLRFQESAGFLRTKTFGQAWYFDSSAIIGNPATLHFHLSFTLFDIHISFPLQDKPGAWTVQIRAGISADPASGATWTFHFTVPDTTQTK